jgi:transcriptional antiterminator RfaH
MVRLTSYTLLKLLDKPHFAAGQNHGIYIAQRRSLTGSNNREHMQRHWYVVYSKARKEEQAQFHLRSKGIDAFFPRLDLTGTSDKRKRITPLFPNYLFVRIQLESEFHRVIWSPGVKRMVSFGDGPVPLDESIVDFLREQTDAEGAIKARSRLRAGQEVEIRGGPFDGLLGILKDPPDARGRVRVLLQLLSRRITVNMGVEFINGHWDSIAPIVTPDIGRSLISAVG